MFEENQSIMGHLFLRFFLLALAISMNAQTLIQNIRGQVVDQQTGLPLIGANVIVEDSEPILGAATDIDGFYRIEGLKLGRYNLICSYIGFEEQRLENVLLTSGKEVAVNFDLVEGYTGAEVVISAVKERDAIESGIALISAKTITAEQAKRFSGTRGDVARTVSGLAGVSANDDSRNDIVIRGNSPTGLLWRVEGVDIPNPSHFGALGATGGPVSMLNNNVLDRSLFLSGSFPALYGNATSGVFDLSLKKGNRDKREYMFQVGFAGMEAGIEGPLVLGKGMTYILNYRYSVLDLISQLGLLDIGTGSGIPAYQDLTFKVNVPTQNAGEFSLFGIAGNSNIEFKPDPEEGSNFYSEGNQNLEYATEMAVLGLSHKYYFDGRTYGKFSASITHTGVKTASDTLTILGNRVPVFRDDSSMKRMAFRYEFNRKVNTRNTLKAGLVTNKLNFAFLDSVLTNDGSFSTTRDFDGSAWLNQGFGQLQHRLSEKSTLNVGLFVQHFGLNNSLSFEPRLGLRHQINNTFRVNLGAGRYSQLQPFQLYFVQTENDNGDLVQTNRDLEFTFSNQLAAGFEWDFRPGWGLKMEGYYQGLSNVPVDPNADGSTYSALNEGANFNLPSRDSLVNEGTGRNYGLEFSVEKNFHKGFYLLTTLSLFDSKYKGFDEVERSTAFDNKWIGNVLAGKEFVLSEKLAITLDSKVTAAGGRRYTPIDISSSITENATVFLDEKQNTEQFGNYFRLDFKVGFRSNGKRVSQTWSVDLQNALDNQNVFGQNYNGRTQSIETNYQLGRYPVIDYILEF